MKEQKQQFKFTKYFFLSFILTIRTLGLVQHDLQATYFAEVLLVTFFVPGSNVFDQVAVSFPVVTVGVLVVAKPFPSADVPFDNSVKDLSCPAGAIAGPNNEALRK